MRLRVFLPAMAVLSLLPLLLTGCSASFDPADSPPVAGSVGNFQGIAQGGQQPILGAHVYLYAASTTAPSVSFPLGGYGGAGIAANTANAATSLLNNTVLTNNPGSSGKDSNNNYYVTTGGGGIFNITGDYTCTAGTQIYVLVTGGTSDGIPADANSAIGLMTALGACPAAGTGSSTYFNNPTGGNYTPFIWVNEVTTVATAYALAGFATDATHIGSSGTTLAKTGIANAFSTTNNLVDFLTTGNARSTTPGSGTNGTGTVPHDEINTLANILAACVNSTTPTSTGCTTLFRNATNDGATCATTCSDEPADTATAAINIAHFPGMNSSNATNNNVYNLYGLQTGTSPFSTHLSAQPNDFSMQIQFTGGGMTAQYNGTDQIGLDASGNVWMVESQGTTTATSGTVLSEFNYLGVPANKNGYTGLGLSLPISLAISADSGHVWMANYDDDNLVDFSISGGTPTPHTVTTGSGPGALAFDSSGNIWLANINTNTLMELTSAGSVSHTFTGNGLNLPLGVAVAPTTSGYIWVADGNGDFSVFNSSGGAVSNPAHPSQPSGVVLDAAGNGWLATSMDIPTLWKIGASGTGATSYIAPSAPGSDVYSIAIDGAGNLWVTGSNFNSHNATNNRIWGMTSSGTSLTGVVNGFPPAPSNTTSPNSIAVDGSGNVWYNSFSDATLHEIVGAGAPVVTPKAYGTVHSTLGTRP